jgi:hypothetical protein
MIVLRAGPSASTATRVLVPLLWCHAICCECAARCVFVCGARVWIEQGSTESYKARPPSRDLN